MANPFQLGDGTVVVPPVHMQTDQRAGMVVPPNIPGINQMQQQPQIQPQVMPQQQLVQPMQYPPQQPQAQQPSPGMPDVAYFQQMAQQQVQQPQTPAQVPAQPPAQPTAVNPQEGTKQPAEGIVTMQPVPKPGFSLGASQNVSLESSDDPAVLKAKIAEMENRRNSEVNAIFNKAIGNDPANKQLLDQFVDKNLNRYEKEAINNVLATGSLVDVQEAMNTLITRFNAAQNAQPTGNPTGQPGQAGAQQAGFNPVNTPAATPASGYMTSEQYKHIVATDPNYVEGTPYAAAIDAQRQRAIKVEQASTQTPGNFGRI